MSTGNPFADFGGVVEEDRFLGRGEEMDRLESRLLGEKAFGSVALIGLPRTGKTSLLSELVRRNEARFPELGILAVRIEVGSFKNAEDLFRGIFDEIADQAAALSFVPEDLKKRIESMRSDDDHPFSTVRKVFRQFRRRALRVLCILDEFDAGRYLLQGTPEVFHWIRELSSTPEIKGSIVLISKRSLRDVARLAGHDSDYWFNVLMALSLCGFSPDDMQFWLDRIGREGIVLSPESRKSVDFWCGQSPFLLDLLAFKAWDANRRGEALTSEWVSEAMKEEAPRYYQQVITVLEDCDTLRKVLQILVGPQWDVSTEDLRALIEYGILLERAGCYVGFCRGFEEYLALIRNDVEIWPLWSETERGIRSYLEDRLRQRFGNDWVTGLKAAQRKLVDLLDNCETNARKDRQRFGDRASGSLLDYSYPMDLYKIMSADWQALGAPLLGQDKKLWATKMSLLSKIRTPIAHNRGEVVQEGEMKQAEGFCREILHRIREFDKSVSSS